MHDVGSYLSSTETKGGGGVNKKKTGETLMFCYQWEVATEVLSEPLD